MEEVRFTEIAGRLFLKVGPTENSTEIEKKRSILVTRSLMEVELEGGILNVISRITSSATGVSGWIKRNTVGEACKCV